MPLTNTAVKNAKPKDKTYRLFDGGGLYLEVQQSGGRYWRLKYRFQGKEKRLALGVYPDVSLAQAREKREEARKDIAQGLDPTLKKQVLKSEQEAQANTLEAVAREWHQKFRSNWTEGHASTIISRLELNVLPFLGDRPIAGVEAPDILTVLKRIEARGAIESAHRVRGILSQVFRYAIAHGLADRDPAADLKGAIPPAKEKHLASITEPKEIGALLRAIDDYSGHHITRCALKLAAYTFVRPGELRHAEWQEIDFEAAEWRIPAEKMKLRRPHVVPLSRQALAVLEDVHPLTGTGRYVFPSMRSPQRAMSENTVLAALRRMGFSREEMCGHGFRSMASTRLNEMGWNSDAIERQLAHVEGNSVRAAYNYAQHLDERRRMMQAWADYLDALKAGGKVIPMHRAAGDE